jgi:hypothetical protein
LEAPFLCGQLLGFQYLVANSRLPSFVGLLQLLLKFQDSSNFAVEKDMIVQPVKSENKIKKSDKQCKEVATLHFLQETFT